MLSKCSSSTLSPIPIKMIPPKSSTLILILLRKCTPRYTPSIENKKLIIPILIMAISILSVNGTNTIPVANASMLVAKASVIRVFHLNGFTFISQWRKTVRYRSRKNFFFRELVF